MCHFCVVLLKPPSLGVRCWIFHSGCIVIPPQSQECPRAHALMSAAPVLSRNDRFSIPGEESDTFLWIPEIRDRPAARLFLLHKVEVTRVTRNERENRDCKRDSFRQQDNHTIWLGGKDGPERVMMLTVETQLAKTPYIWTSICYTCATKYSASGN